jgi:tape measure domain-containing protein
MKQIDAKLRITAQSEQAQTSLQRLRGGVQSISQTLQQLRNQAVAFFAAQVGVQQIGALAQLADSYAGLSARLRIVTQGQAEFNAALATTRQQAAQYSQPLSETTQLYTRMLSALRPLGGGLREAGVASEAMLAALRITGATGPEAASAILQFSQAMAAGALRGEEFNAVAEAAPRLLDALAAGLGRPRGELKSLAEQGQLTASAVVQALGRELPSLRREAASIPDTIGSATQGVRNAMLQLVGATAEGSQGVAVIVGALHLLRDNLGAVVTGLTALAVALSALKLRAFAAGIAAAGVAAGTAATGVTVFGAAMNIALRIITGPVGWIITLGMAAAAWLALGRAKDKAAARTTSVVQQELTAAEAELAAARQAAAQADRNSVFRASAQQRGEVTLADGRVRRLRAELQRLQEDDAAAAEADRETQRLQRRGAAVGADLASPKVVADTQAKYRSRLAIDMQYADERAAYILAKDKEIERARAVGSAPAYLAQLERQKADTLAQMEQARQKDLQQFDAQGRATRVAQAKAAFDAELSLAADAIEREKAANQARYDQGLMDFNTYLQRREQLEDSEVDLRLRRLQEQLAAEERALQTNRQRLARAPKGNDKEGLAEAVTAAENKRAELQAEIARALRDQQGAEQARLHLVREVNRELQQQRQGLQQQIEDAQGAPLSRDRLRERALAAQQPTLDRLRVLGDSGAGRAQVLRLVDLQVTAAELAQLERLVGRTQQQLSLQEAEIQRQVAAGALTSVEAERELLRVREQQLPVLEQLLAQMDALASSPADRQRVEELRQRIAALRDAGQELQRTLRTQAVNDLSRMLANIATGAQTTKHALLDMVRSFAQAMLDLLARRMAEQLVGQFQAAAGGGAAGNWFATAANWIAGLFHAGGLVGAPGGMRRSVPVAAFAFAPRYHSGGIAGLGPDELPAILRRGEEVLTEDDPRHRANGQRMRGPVIGNLNISVSVEGHGGDGADATLARRLAGMLEAAVQTRLADELRPGGMLYARG